MGLGHVRLDPSGGHSGHADVMGAEGQGQRLGQGVQAGLGGSISRRLGFAPKGTARADVDDASCPSLTDQGAGNEVGEMGGSCEIDVDEGLKGFEPLGLLGCGEWRQVVEAGIVDQNGRHPHGRRDRIDQGMALISVPQIGCEALVTVPRKMGDHLSCIISVCTVVDGETCTEMGEAAGDGAPDAA